MSLIVIEGLDGSGKGTQISLLFEKLKSMGKDVIHISFPDYDSPSSSLVKMYLAGEFGTDADSVNGYAASTFYAADRYAGFAKSWGEDYRSGKMILADRYTTSNMVYQMTKAPKNEWAEMAEWIEDLEYVKLGLPRPDKVIYLDMPPEVSQKLLMKRYGGDANKKDIHESNVKYLLECREAAAFAADKFGWTVINCSENGEPRSLESISKDVFDAVADTIKE